MSAKRASNHRCFFCGNPIDVKDRSNRHVFPLPKRFKVRSNVGATACPECSPKIYKEQRAEGQLERVGQILDKERNDAADH